MLNAVLLPLRRHYALRRFWNSARGFWHGPTARLAWKLIALLIAVIVLQIPVGYRLNLWNRDFFDALEFLDGGEIWHQIQLLVLFAAVSMVLTVLAVGRMTFHCSRRGWGSRHRIGAWLSGERYRRINLWNGGHRNARYRIAEDARLATDPLNCVQGTMLLGDAARAAAFVALQGGG